MNRLWLPYNCLKKDSLELQNNLDRIINELSKIPSVEAAYFRAVLDGKIPACVILCLAEEISHCQATTSFLKNCAEIIVRHRKIH